MTTLTPSVAPNVTPTLITGSQIRSTVTSNNTIEISLIDVELPPAAADEIIIKVEATPLNPSDQASLFGVADITTVRASGNATSPHLSFDIPPHYMGFVATRLGKPLPVGGEGAGVVIAAGSSKEAQALLGKTVSIWAGGMFAQYRCVKHYQCMVMPEHITAKEAASSFINPMTALAMIETMRSEGHTALAHAAAASNLGQMLNRVCLDDGIDLVNIVRKPEQVALLKEQGAKYVVNSSSDSFISDLTAALVATGATIAFDPIGGGKLASDILSAMENVATAKMQYVDHYGSTVKKQVYIFGGLNMAPITLDRAFGFEWSISGWLLTNFLAKVDSKIKGQMIGRITAEINTTFASHYSQEISLAEALTLDAFLAYSKRLSNEKFLITPHK